MRSRTLLVVAILGWVNVAVLLVGMPVAFVVVLRAHGLDQAWITVALMWLGSFALHQLCQSMFKRVREMERADDLRRYYGDP